MLMRVLRNFQVERHEIRLPWRERFRLLETLAITAAEDIDREQRMSMAEATG